MGALTNEDVAEALITYLAAGCTIERCIMRSDGEHMNVNVKFPSGRVYGFDWLAADGAAPLVDWAERQAADDERVVEGMAKCEAARSKVRR